MNSSFAQLLSESCQQAGFDTFSVIDIDALESPEFKQHWQRYQQWIDQGYFGTMQYLERGIERRRDPRSLLPETKSILCLAIPYPSTPSLASQAQYASYLRNDDYHREIQLRLERLIVDLKQKWLIKSQRELLFKICVDTSAVLERSWAALSGLGWIGKNAMLLTRKHGSYFFLAEVLLSEASGNSVRLHKNYCGNCRRCLDACPTQAFDAQGALDARKCISYWTLEHRGILNLDETSKRSMGKRLAGCDVCQESCPFNFKRMQIEETFDARHLVKDWYALLSESEDEYKLRVRASSLKRVKPEMFRRNLAIAFSNALLDADPSQRPSFISCGSALLTQLRKETDSIALIEWRRCWAIYQSLIETESVEFDRIEFGTGKVESNRSHLRS